jgi:hypothetical protein
MTDKNLLRIGFFGVFLGCLISFSACGSDSSSSADDGEFFSSNSQEDGSADSKDGKTEGSSGSTTDSSGSNSTSKQDTKTETVSSKEALMPESKKVNGTCATTTGKIGKGELATWKFYRNDGSVIEQIMAPFKWSFTGGNTETLQGNGLDEVNVRYENAGTATATLNVDGNEIKCEPLQVQGIPITIKSCTAKPTTVNAGSNVTWTVEASSESDITEYSWTSAFGTVSGNGTTGTMTASAEMHKKNITATVTVTNKDKTSESFICDGAMVLDPESVDLVLTVATNNVFNEEYSQDNRINLPDDMFIPEQEPITVQIPLDAPTCNISCVPRVGADDDALRKSGGITWNGEPVSNLGYFSPAGCAPGKKYSVEAVVKALCIVIKQ